jgi:hypothetical protein
VAWAIEAQLWKELVRVDLVQDDLHHSGSSCTKLHVWYLSLVNKKPLLLRVPVERCLGPDAGTKQSTFYPALGLPGTYGVEVEPFFPFALVCVLVKQAGMAFCGVSLDEMKHG